MTHNIPADVQDRMLFAVNNFDESFKTDAFGAPRDYKPDTKEFWEALAAWAPFALVGSFNMTMDTETGAVAIMFSPTE